MAVRRHYLMMDTTTSLAGRVALLFLQMSQPHLLFLIQQQPLLPVHTVQQADADAQQYVAVAAQRVGLEQAVAHAQHLAELPWH